MVKRIGTSLIPLVAVISVTSPLFLASAAQMELGVIQGTVVDEAGKPLEGVMLRLRDLERGRETSIKSDNSGRFYRRGLQAVEYEMAVEKDGYQPIKDRVKLVAGSDRRFDFKLVRAAPEGADEFTKGVNAFNSGDNAGAAQAFEAAAQKAPTLPEIRVNLALAYKRLGRAADAVAQLDQAASLASDDAKILFQLGGAYVDLQAYDKAVAAFERGLAKPGAQPTYDAMLTLGAVYFAKGDIDKAIEQFDRALAVKPGAAAPTLGLAKAHFSKGDVDKAVKLFEQVMAAHPGTPEATQAETFLKELRKDKEDDQRRTR
jgi:tetratricopeptide (TPR) repeat protein